MGTSSNAQDGNDHDGMKTLEGLVPVADYAQQTGLDEATIIQSIASGVLTGANISGQWHVVPPYAQADDRSAARGSTQQSTVISTTSPKIAAAPVPELPPQKTATEIAYSKHLDESTGNVAAWVSLVSGLVSIVFYEFFIPQIFALVSGALALSELRRDDKRRRIAIAGVVLGVIYVILPLAMLAVR